MDPISHVTVGSLLVFDVSSGAGVSLRQIPVAVRDEHGYADTRSLAALFNDSTLAGPAQELLYGTTRRYAEFFHVSERQAYSILRTGSLHTHQCSNSAFRVTLVQSAQWYRTQHEAHISDVRRAAGKHSGEVRREAANTKWENELGAIMPVRWRSG